MNRWRLSLLVIAVVGGVVAFWAFRPDTLFLDDRVDEQLDEAFADRVDEQPDEGSTDPTPVASSREDEPVGESPSAEPPDTTPVAPIALASGTFRGIDHRAEGTATIYEADRRFVLRLEEDTDIQNGPDLYVWLLPTSDYEGGTPTDFIDLGRLKGNLGGQNYDLPEGFDPDGPFTVLIWCRRFAVPFAAAPLA